MRRRKIIAERRVAAIVLAAGLSRRWGADNKLLAPIGGVAMIRRAVEAVAESQIRPIIVVTGHDANAIEAALAGLPIAFAPAADFADGISASVKAGIAAAPADCDAVLMCLGDMPWIRPATLDRLAASYDPAAGFVASIPTIDGRRGNPALLGRRLFADIARLSGDQGAGRLLAAMLERVREIPVDDPGVLRDVDQPESLAAPP